MNFLVYATTDNKNFIHCGVIEGSAFVTFASNVEQCKLPWDVSKVGYRVLRPFVRHSPLGLAVMVQKDFILTL